MAHLPDPNPFDPDDTDDVPELDETDQRRADITAAREYVVLGGVAEAGEPVVFKEEAQELTDQGYIETKVQRLTFCCGCHAAILEPAHIGARCVICGRILCPTCSANRCAFHTCGKSVCPADREQLGTSVYCRPHFIAHLARLIAAALICAGLVALVISLMF